MIFATIIAAALSYFRYPLTYLHHGAGSKNSSIEGYSSTGLLFTASPSTQGSEERGSGELNLHVTDTATLLWDRGP